MRPKTRDTRFDFRGGSNPTYTQDVVDTTEVRVARNMRHNSKYGGLEKRGPTQKIHTDQLESGALIVGLHTWTNPSGVNQVVVIAGGHFFHKIQSASTFTKIAQTPTLSTTERCRFQEHRAGATIVLYIAQGSSVYKWDGTTFSQSVTGAPDALDLQLYKGRLFASDDSKTVYYTDPSKPEVWGASADVETFDTKPLVALLVNGSSLCLFKQDTVARFTGDDTNTIRIDRETEGVSVLAGAIARGTVIEAEDFFFMLSDRGPYLGTEEGVQYVGGAVEDVIAGWTKSSLPNAVAGYNRGRREIVLVGPNGGSENNQALIFSLVTQTWLHAWDFPFNVCTLSRHELDDGTETLLAGGYDGYVRDLDARTAGLQAVDDAARDGSGGTDMPASVTLPDIIGGVPGDDKDLTAIQYVRTDLDAGGKLVIEWSNESADSGRVPGIKTTGAGLRTYPFQSAARGTAITLTLKEETDAKWLFTAIDLDLTVTQR